MGDHHLRGDAVEPGVVQLLGGDMGALEADVAL